VGGLFILLAFGQFQKFGGVVQAIQNGRDAADGLVEYRTLAA